MQEVAGVMKNNYDTLTFRKRRRIVDSTLQREQGKWIRWEKFKENEGEVIAKQMIQEDTILKRPAIVTPMELAVMSLTRCSACMD